VVRAISAYLGADPAAVTTQRLASWLARPGLSRATRAVYLFHLQAWCRWRFTVGLVNQDPAAGLSRIRVPKGPPGPVTTTVLGQILRCAVAPYLTYFGLASYAGLRCLEIVTLDREDITEESMWIRGKGDKVREVPTHPVVWRLVEPLPRGRIWHLPGYEPHVAAHKLSMYGSRTLTRLGFPDVTMHMLRHWYGSETYRRSRNLRATQELLGHASIATTERYTQVSSEERRLAVRALPAVA
jgi:integrase/recombinase XerC